MAKRKTQVVVPALDRIEPTNPLNVRSVYVNNLQVAGSSMDMRLIFSEIILDHGKASVEQRANIVMSIPHFIATVQLLNDQLGQMIKTQSKQQQQLAEAKDVVKA
jgi:hypothetical protein